MKHIKNFFAGFFGALFVMLVLMGAAAFVILPPYILVALGGDGRWWMLLPITISCVFGSVAVVVKGG